jgi:hypothetical protein
LDEEWYVFVEQDVLLFGKGIVEREIQNSKSGMFFGREESGTQPIQQGFYGVRRDKIVNFNKKLSCIPERDGDISPEVKFLWAGSWLPIWVIRLMRLVIKILLSLLPIKYNRDALTLQILNSVCLRFKKFDFALSRGGRNRPINMDQEFYYLTLASLEEIEAYDAYLSRG